MLGTVDPTVRVELGRVGISIAAAGYASGVLAIDLGDDEIRILGPPSETPRRSWDCTEAELLELLAQLPDGAGVDAFWALVG